MMLDLPRGVWRWIEANAKDVARIADALEKLVEEVKLVREALEEDDTKEESE